ncbi:Ribosome biogenesis protein 1 [Trebouxia sp. C0010 RCD-2024]
MRKRIAVGANEPAASSSGSEAADEELFAAEQRLGGAQPAAEPAWSDDDEAHSGSDQSSEDSEQDSDGAATGSAADTDVDSETSSAAEGSASDDDDLDTAIVDYAAAAHQHADGAEPDPLAAVPDGGPEGVLQVDEGSDSSEDERPPRNTVGEVPLQWYNDEQHIGYDHDAKKLIKRTRKDKLETLLAQTDTKQGLRTIYDEYNDEEIVLSKDELRMIQRIRQGQFPDVEVNPYEPEMNWFTDDTETMPLSAAPEPKRRFIPSKWEEKKVVKLVRALRKGWIKRSSERNLPQKEPEAYLLWADDGMATDRTATGLSYVPASKTKLPGHEESYNPPKEYLPSEEERNAQELLDDEDKPDYTPQAFDSLRQVPMYSLFIKERFERCLDLYLCPRSKKKRINVDPQSLIPKLPKPQDLQPFPSTLLLRYTGHTARVRSVSPDPSGQWLASSADDGSVRLWEVRTGRCTRTWTLGGAVHCVAWCPNPTLSLLAAAVDTRVILLPTGAGTDDANRAIAEILREAQAGDGAAAVAAWQGYEGEGVSITHKHPVTYLTWHSKGDYFASVAPTGNTQAVLVHQLSKHTTQNPFRKNRGRVVRVLFHPLKPFLFVATQNHVRVYNLAQQALAKKLIGGSGSITSMAIHPGGDHVIVGSEDKRLAWYDLDLSTKPYRALRYHSHALRSVAFHKKYPLFASASDDASVHIFHGMVYQDLMTNPLIVPVKILRGHEMNEFEGVFDCAFHPTQPWIFTAGADATIGLFTN